jgi:hypothetical protein
VNSGDVPSRGITSRERTMASPGWPALPLLRLRTEGKQHTNWPWVAGRGGIVADVAVQLEPL